MDHIERKAYAKINLGLDVLRRRANGYHEVKMVMQTVDIWDWLTFTKKDQPGVELSVGDAALPAGKDNLICRAAWQLLCHKPRAPVRKNDYFGSDEEVFVRGVCRFVA